jgi:hypothetical protein
MYHVALLVDTPSSGQKAIPTSDDFCIKISGELWPVVRESPNAEIATEEGGGKVDVHYRDCHIITIAPALLCALESCARIKAMVAL